MKEKIIQGGIVNGEKMLVCPTWEDEIFQKSNQQYRRAVSGSAWINSAVDVSWWERTGSDCSKNMDTHWIPNHWRSFRNMYRNMKKVRESFLGIWKENHNI